jgi:hypothetical protein
VSDNPQNQNNDQNVAGHPADDSERGTIQIPNSQVHPALGESRHPDETTQYTVKVNGDERKVSAAELIEGYQKSTAAGEKFQEAAQLRGEAAKAIALQEDLQALVQGDQDAFRRIGAAMGANGEEVEAALRQSFGDPEDEDDEDVIERYYEDSRKSEPRLRNSNPENGPIDYSRLTPDIQRVLREAESGRIDKIVDKALDSDEELSYNMSQYDEKGKAAIRTLLNEKIRGRLDEHGGDFGDGRRILAEVLPEVKGLLSQLGGRQGRPGVGLGASPGGGDTQVYPTKKPDYVPSTGGDDFEQHILDTLAFHQGQVERGRS